jgi:hypothetical protein
MTRHVGQWMLLLASPDTYPECAVAHQPDEPHNQQSLYWQLRFHQKHGRFPTWADAMSHCTPEVQEDWRAKLIKHRVRRLF